MRCAYATPHSVKDDWQVMNAVSNRVCADNDQRCMRKTAGRQQRRQGAGLFRQQSQWSNSSSVLLLLRGCGAQSAMS